MEELWDDYLKYLIRRYGLKREKRYYDLFKILHDIEFVWILDRDENREADGRDVRYDYDIPKGCEKYLDEFIERPVSVLEVLLAIADRIEREYIGDPADERPDIFFMEMIKNLGLTGLIVNNGEEVIEDIVNRWMRRMFLPDGYGSPFPVRYDRRDQRKLEIFDQVLSYINENYG